MGHHTSLHRFSFSPVPSGEGRGWGRPPAAVRTHLSSPAFSAIITGDGKDEGREAMEYWQVHIAAGALGREALSGVLDALGVEQYEVIEEPERIAAFLRDMAPYWDYVEDDVLEHGGDTPGIRFYVVPDECADALLASLRQAVALLRGEPWAKDAGPLVLSAKRVDEEDWANNWKQYYKPLPIGERLLICPAWETADATDRFVLTLNPGMVFGTGQHETTALCLQELEARVKSGMRVLDVGCGSGILSIAALLLGASGARGIDIDPLAEKIVAENAAMNGIAADKLTAVTGNAVQDPSLLGEDASCDIVVANIVADVIVLLAPHLPRVLKRGGAFIASGIIAERENDVRRAMEKAGFTVVKTVGQNGWMAVVAQAERR